MKFYELTPMGNDRAKSFYGKARVIEKDNGETVLLSYDTEVCKITKSGEVVRLWGGYSATTMRHVNSFLELFDIAGGGKSWWDTLTAN
jgi:N12 class adenine-specific DNA methylase